MLIVGLGNPGSKYQNNRHNVGFMAVDEIIHRHNFCAPQKKFKGELSTGQIAGHKVYIIKPQTYMNDSGICVSEIANFYKIPLSDIYVFYDELDIPIGKIKTKIGGGAGGHNGIRSIDAHLGKNYNRIRIGIDHPGHRDKVHSYVLGDFKKNENAEIHLLINKVSDLIDVLLYEDNVNFTTKLSL